MREIITKAWPLVRREALGWWRRIGAASVGMFGGLVCAVAGTDTVALFLGLIMIALGLGAAYDRGQAAGQKEGVRLTLQFLSDAEDFTFTHVHKIKREDGDG